MIPAGLEPAIPGSVGRCLIHWATGPDACTVHAMLRIRCKIVWGYFGATLDYFGITLGLPWGYPGATLGLPWGDPVGLLPSSRWKRQPIYKHSKQRLGLLLMPPKTAVV